MKILIKEIIRLETIISNEQDDYKKLQLQWIEQEKVINFVGIRIRKY